MPVSEYNHILVAVSFAVAIFASYTALNMAGRVAGSARSNARIWLMGGGFALGVGIWAMHFVGMLAMDHAMNMRFDPFLTGLSMLIAIGSSLFALWLVSAEKLRLRRLLPGALVMGLGISAMHYTGMAALQFASIIVWNSAWVALSIIIALLASCGALWLTFRLRHEGTDVALKRAGAAVLMGIAIAGMHYAGMKAAHFPQNWPMEHRGVDSNWLAVLVSVVALTILALLCWFLYLTPGFRPVPYYLPLRWHRRTRNWRSWRCMIRSPVYQTGYSLRIVWNRPSAKRIGKARLSRYCLWIWMALKPLMTLMVMILAISYWWRSRIV